MALAFKKTVKEKVMSATVILNGKISAAPRFKKIENSLYLIFNVSSKEKNYSSNHETSHQVVLDSSGFKESDLDVLEKGKFVSIQGTLKYREDSAFIEARYIEFDSPVTDNI